MRRGEIAINVVIMIALGLLVLVILAILLSGAFERADKQTSSCEQTYSGNCMTRTVCELSSGRVVEGVSCEDSTTYDYGSTRVESFPEGGTVCCVRR